MIPKTKRQIAKKGSTMNRGEMKLTKKKHYLSKSKEEKMLQFIGFDHELIGVGVRHGDIFPSHAFSPLLLGKK